MKAQEAEKRPHSCDPESHESRLRRRPYVRPSHICRDIPGNTRSHFEAVESQKRSRASNMEHNGVQKVHA